MQTRLNSPGKSAVPRLRRGDGGALVRQRGKRSLNELAYERIKQLIVTLRLRPGEHLNAASLSESLRIGRTPVLQAINRLMFDGLVDVIPRKGVIVRPVSLNEVLEIVDVRLVNEIHCARLAATRAEPGDIRALEGFLKEADRAIKAGDIERQMHIDREFHMALSRASGNAVLGEIMRALHERSLRFWFVSLRSEHHHVAVRNEHKAIVDALKARDPDRAARAVAEHIESFRRNISRNI